MPEFNASVLFTGPSVFEETRLYYALATLCDLAYSRNTDWVERYRQWGGFASSVIVDIPTAWTPNFVIMKDPRGTVVAVSGTENFEQILRYTVFSFLLPISELPGCTVVNGFRQMYAASLPFCEAQLADLPAGTPLVFTGHSMGGAIALLLALHYRNDPRFSLRRVVTVAAPRVGNSVLKEVIKDLPLTAFAGEGDPIPYLPPRFQRNFPFTPIYGLVRAGYDYEPNTVSRLLSDLGTVRRLELETPNALLSKFYQRLQNWVDSSTLDVAGLTSDLRDTLTHHSIRTYIQRLYNYWVLTGRLGDISDLFALNGTIAGDAFFGDVAQRATEFVGSDAVEALSDPTISTVTDPTLIPLDPPTPEPLQIVVPATIAISGIASAPAQYRDLAPAPPPQQLPQFDPLRFETGPRRNWLHKGRDRRILMKLWQVLLAIQARDGALADRQVDGQGVQTPYLLDPADAELLEAFAEVLDVAELHLSLFYS